MLDQVARWARLGQEPCSQGSHDFDLVCREQRCRQCQHLFVSLDHILDADVEGDNLADLLCMSPKQQTCAMDDSFLEDLDHANNRTRRLKRQSECLNNLQPRLGKYAVLQEPTVIKFRQNIKSSLPSLFPKINAIFPEETDSIPPPQVMETETELEDILVCVKFQHDRGRPFALTRTVMCLPATATVRDVMDAVANKLITTVEELYAEFSPRDIAGAFLGFDDAVRETVILRARSLSL